MNQLKQENDMYGIILNEDVLRQLLNCSWLVDMTLCLYTVSWHVWFAVGGEEIPQGLPHIWLLFHNPHTGYI